MSSVKTLTPNPHDVYKLIDPRVSLFDAERKYYTSQGCTECSVLQYQATNYSPDSLSFTITTASPNTMVHKKIYVNYTVELQDNNPVTVDDVFPEPNTQAQLTDNEGLRPYCLTAATQNLTVGINGQEVSWQPSEVITKIASFNNQNHVSAESGYPVMLPQFMANPSIGVIVGNGCRNENAPYENQFAPQNMMSNNVFNYSALVTDAGPNIKLTVRFSCVEPVICSPFEFGGSDNPAIYGCNKININYSGIMPGRMWSSQVYDIGTADDLRKLRNMVSGPNGLFIGTPTVSVMYFTPPVFLPIPPELSYPIFEVINYKTQMPTLAPGQYANVTSNVIPLKCIPSMVYIFFGNSLSQQQTANALPNTANPYGAAIASSAFNESCALISSVNISFGNKNGILSNANCYDLYNISKKNGCTMSFTQWSGAAYRANQVFDTTNLAIWERPGIGSVLALSPAEDFGLPDDLSSGCMTYTQIVVNAKIYNGSVSGTNQSGVGGGRISESHDYVMYVVLINDGILTVNTKNFTWNKTMAPISRTQSVAAPIVSNNSKWKQFKNMWGGGYKSIAGSKFTNFLRDHKILS